MADKKIYQVVMPKLGLIMEQAILLEWFKKDGDWVQKGEPLFSLESEKSTIEIESPASGKLQILVLAGENVAVMTPIARLAGGGDFVEDSEAGSIVKDDETEPSDNPIIAISKNARPRFSGIAASPKARSFAQTRGLDLTTVRGTGPRGMIVTNDLDEMKKQIRAIKATPLARKVARDLGVDLASISGSGPDGRIHREDVHNSVAARLVTSRQETSRPSGVELPLEGLRGVIARRLTEGWQERPQVTLITEINVSALVQARNRLIQDENIKLSYNAILASACALAIHKNPHVNVQLGQQGTRQLGQINIGIAVDTENGLLVPVLREVDKKNVIQVEAEMKELISRTLAGKVLPDDLSGGSFTITNLGAFGVDAFTPIINPPELMILGVGRIMPRPIVINGDLVVRDTLTLSLAFDHRLIDGVPAARFLQHLTDLLKEPANIPGLNQ